MKKSDQVNREIENILESSQSIKKVDAPTGIYDSVMIKLSQDEKRSFDYSPVLKWAAIGLLILVNAMSYSSFINQSGEEQEYLFTDVDNEIEELVAEYQISDFVYSEY